MRIYLQNCKNHHRTEPKPAPIPMSNRTIKGDPCLERLLCVKLTLDLK